MIELGLCEEKLVICWEKKQQNTVKNPTLWDVCCHITKYKTLDILVKVLDTVYLFCSLKWQTPAKCSFINISHLFALFRQ